MDDENWIKKFTDHVKANARPKGQPNMTLESLAIWVNTELGLSEEEKYSPRTVADWLHRLNFNVTTAKKKLYFDGHEREDVIADRS